MYHVLSKVTGDTWNWKIVRSPSTSGRCCRDRGRTAGRRRVGNQPTNDFPATRRRQHRRPSGSVQPFLNATPLRRPRYLITRFTHSSPLSESRGTSPPGRYTRAPRECAKCTLIACCGIGERFFSPSAHERRRSRVRHNCTRAARRAPPDRSSHFLACRTPRDDDTMSQMVRRRLSAGPVASPRNRPSPPRSRRRGRFPDVVVGGRV